MLQKTLHGSHKIIVPEKGYSFVAAAAFCALEGYLLMTSKRVFCETVVVFGSMLTSFLVTGTTTTTWDGKLSWHRCCLIWIGIVHMYARISMHRLHYMYAVNTNNVLVQICTCQCFAPMWNSESAHCVIWHDACNFRRFLIQFRKKVTLGVKMCCKSLCLAALKKAPTKTGCEPR